MTILDQSLCLLDGVSPEAEIRLRRAGVLSCRQLAAEVGRRFSARHAMRVAASFSQMERASRLGLADWFVAHLPAGHRIRALAGFPERVLFYDIETDGTGRGAAITCVTTLRAGRIRTFVRGRDLEGFLDDWAAAGILVGFNSKRFDTPFVLKEFGLTAPPPQIDLMDEAAHYGFRGGLKTIEKNIGFVRSDISCANGADAVETWRKFCEGGDEAALAVLLRYNRDDVLSLLHLASRLLRLSLENTLILDNRTLFPEFGTGLDSQFHSC